jgi:hypothetical protein
MSVSIIGMIIIFGQWTLLLSEVSVPNCTGPELRVQTVHRSAPTILPWMVYHTFTWFTVI